jgi:hypothetical protein
MRSFWPHSQPWLSPTLICHSWHLGSDDGVFCSSVFSPAIRLIGKTITNNELDLPVG